MGRTPLLLIILLFLSNAVLASETQPRDFDSLELALERCIPRLASMLGEGRPVAESRARMDFSFEELIDAVGWAAEDFAGDLGLAHAALADAGREWDRARAEVLAAVDDGDPSLARNRFAERFAPCSVELFILIEASRRAANQ